MSFPTLDALICGGCSVGLNIVGFLSHDLYPALAVVSMLSSTALSIVGLSQFYLQWRERRKGKRK